MALLNEADMTPSVAGHNGCDRRTASALPIEEESIVGPSHLWRAAQQQRGKTLGPQGGGKRRFGVANAEDKKFVGDRNMGRWAR